MARPDPTRWATRWWHHGGLARRLFLLFLLVAWLPLALSDWVSSVAVAQIADRLSLEHRARTTRQVSRQVFDRLLAGKTLLQALPAAPDVAQADRLQPLGRVLSAVGWVDALAPDARASPLDALQRAWVAAEAPGDRDRPSPLARDGAVRLRLAAGPGTAPRVLLGATDATGRGWIAEVDLEHLLQPVADAGEDAEWTVTTASGTVLALRRGADYADVAAEERVDTQTRLFLGGELGAPDWLFVQRAERPRAMWFGQRLTVWLAMTALGTLLFAALVGRWQIGRAVEPLRRLTAGANRLAAGAAGTRVAVRRDDEIGALAGAFNEMAGRIETQFESMQGLAAIDRAILAGAPFARLAGLTLEQLAAHYPEADACVHWRARDGALLGLARMRGATGNGVVAALDAAQRAAFEAAHADAQAGAVTTLPLWQQGRVEALIRLVLSGDTPPAPGRLQPAIELRDRLAVALATHAREQLLVHRAAHDSLTGLLNRYGLNDSVDALLGEPGEAPVVAVMLLDLDHFKDVNDSRGHDVGDELLCLVSQRLMAAVPPGTLVAREGGDEFALVAKVADAAAADAIAAAAIAALVRPFELDGIDCRLGASAGVALFPAHGNGRDELLRCADVALYAAKAAGRGRHTFFNAELDRAAGARVQLVGELQRAVERNEFVVHYQPRVLPGSGEIRSAEALVRWQHPQRGLLYPDAFIAQAEASGVIDALGDCVLDIACAQLAAWRQQGVPLERVSVNVSPQQLVSGRLVETVRATLARHQVPATALELEVTESLLVGDVASASAQLGEMRGWGVTIALDDFGTGYSSMSTLHQLPIDVIKIDRAFVQRLGSGDGAEAVVRAIVSLAGSLRLHLVAEGVETPAQAALLAAMDCDELQGYLYSRPVPPAAFIALPGLGRWPAGGVGVSGSRTSSAAPVPT